MDRSILRQQVGGRKIYFAQEFDIEGAEWAIWGRRASPPARPSSCSAEAAKPYVDKGKEAAEKAYEEALRLAKQLVEKSRGEGAANKQRAGVAAQRRGFFPANLLATALGGGLGLWVMNGRLAGRLALVTGATRGIGRAVALAYAREGAHLILVGRTTGALEEVDDEVRMAGGSATLLTLNLKQHDKIDGLGPTIYQRWGRLDILVGNAGILGPLSPLGHVSADAWSEVITINLTANWRLIRTLDPLLRRSDAGRAIFVSSGVAVTPRAYWGPYAVSKAGLEALIKVYAHEVANTPVRANLVNPGPTRTGMRAKAFPGEDPMSLKTPADIAPSFVRLAEPSCTDNGKLFDLRTGEVR